MGLSFSSFRHKTGNFRFESQTVFQIFPLLKFSFLALVFPLAINARVDFVHQVMPILRKHCAECHTDGKKKGGLSMNTRHEFLAGGEGGEIAVPGSAADSWFIDLTASADLDERMPPKGPGLADEEIDLLRKWVNEGMIWEEGVTLGSSAWEPQLKPRIVDLPPARNGRSHPIDRILDHYADHNEIDSPRSAPSRIFARRAYLDLIGILPTPEELNAFLTDDSPNREAELVDRLLSREVAYADHWLTFWNDLLRNDYTGTGFITGGRRQITTWLYAALRENMPYHQMTRELIDAEEEAAGFINGIEWRGSVNASQTRDMQFAQNVSQVFLGINMKCASCHDSFIDRWTLQEAYDLAAVFSDKPLELERCDVPTGKMATPKWMFPEIGQIDPKADRKERLRQLAGLLTHPDNGRFTRTIANRIWAQLMGRGIVHPVDAMHTKPWSEDLLDFLAFRLAKDGYDLKKFIKLIMTSKAYGAESDRLASSPGEEYQFKGPVPKRMTAEQLMDTIWQVTSTHPLRSEAKVDRSFKTTTHSPSKSVAFPKVGKISAQWIWSSNSQTQKIKLRKSVDLKSAPKLASVVATCDNAFSLRVNGRPLTSSSEWTQPVLHEVSDFFKAGKNDIEVDAEMFGGSSGFIAQFSFGEGKEAITLATDHGWEVEEANKWVPAKVVHKYGSGPWGKILDNPMPSKAGDNPGHGPSIRAALVKNDFLMRSLGRPHRDQVVTSRPAELTTLQAIDLANGEILSKYLSKGASNLISRASDGPSFVDWLYEHTLGRLPTNGERKIIDSMITNPKDSRQVEDLLWLVFMQPDFQIIR